MKASLLAGSGTLLVTSLVLSGCGGSYLREAVHPEQATPSTRFEGNWSGELESRYRLRLPSSSRAIGKGLLCEPYRDRIRLSVDRGQLSIDLGKATEYRLETHLDDQGRFFQRMPLGSKPHRYGSREAELWVAGELDASNGIAEGVVAVNPAGITYGCLGDFKARKDTNLTPVPTSSTPFTTEYRFVTMDEDKL